MRSLTFRSCGAGADTPHSRRQCIRAVAARPQCAAQAADGDRLVFRTERGYGPGFFITRIVAQIVLGNLASTIVMWLVQRQSPVAGISTPEVAVYESPELNAFASGARRNSALVAVSTGLMNRMSEVEAVLGHEISHVANGDMVTTTRERNTTNVLTTP